MLFCRVLFSYPERENRIRSIELLVTTDVTIDYKGYLISINPRKAIQGKEGASVNYKDYAPQESWQLQWGEQ